MVNAIIFTTSQEDARNYQKVVKILVSLGDAYVFQNLVLIETNLTPKMIYERINPLWEARQVFILQIVAGIHYGWLPDQAWKWLKRHGLKSENTGAENEGA